MAMTIEKRMLRGLGKAEYAGQYFTVLLACAVIGWMLEYLTGIGGSIKGLLICACVLLAAFGSLGLSWYYDGKALTRALRSTEAELEDIEEEAASASALLDAERKKVAEAIGAAQQIAARFKSAADEVAHLRKSQQKHLADLADAKAALANAQENLASADAQNANAKAAIAKARADAEALLADAQKGMDAQLAKAKADALKGVAPALQAADLALIYKVAKKIGNPNSNASAEEKQKWGSIANACNRQLKAMADALTDEQLVEALERIGV